MLPIWVHVGAYGPTLVLCSLGGAYREPIGMVLSATYQHVLCKCMGSGCELRVYCAKPDLEPLQHHKEYAWYDVRIICR